MSYVDDLRERCFYYRDFCIARTKCLSDQFEYRMAGLPEQYNAILKYARSLNIRWCKLELQQSYYETAIEKLTELTALVESQLKKFERSAGMIFAPYIPLHFLDTANVYSPYIPLPVPKSVILGTMI